MVCSAPFLRSAAALCLTAGLVNAASAQAENWLTRLFQPQATAMVAPPAGGAHEWSGQSGSSGSPLMTADAIRAAAAEFSGCIEAMWPLAERRGVSAPASSVTPPG